MHRLARLVTVPTNFQVQVLPSPYTTFAIPSFTGRSSALDVVMADQQANKPHRRSGKEKADKKSGSVKHQQGNNPKAFTSQSGAKASRLARQKVEKDQKKLHVPAIDRTFGGYGAGAAGSKSSTLGTIPGALDEGPPPVIVAVMGPPGVSCVLFQVFGTTH